MQWLLSNLNPMLSLKTYPKMAMAKSCAKKSNACSKLTSFASNILDHVDHNDRSHRESLTTIVTDSHATSRIGDAKLKDIPSRADTSSSSPYPSHDINHGFSDSDLTEIDDDEEPIVSDATPGNLGDSAGSGIIEAGNTFNSATEMNHHSACCPHTHFQSLLCEEHNSLDGEGHSRSTSAPAKTVNNTCCSSQLQASKQKETQS